MKMQKTSTEEPRRRDLLAGALKSGLAVFVGAATGGLISSARAQAVQQNVSVLHVAINVADLERTTQFYTRVFGFKASPPITPDAQAARIFGLPDPIDIKALIMTLGNMRILVRQFDNPKYNGPPRDLPVIYPGWGDIALRVSDVEQIIDNVRRYGGTVFENTRTIEGTPEKPGPEVVFVADPDGARIEIVSF
jgi:catechol 2,3-dioxygenase-like lactoylglutathione lyase family enzyme